MKAKFLKGLKYLSVILITSLITVSSTYILLIKTLKTTTTTTTSTADTVTLTKASGTVYGVQNVAEKASVSVVEIYATITTRDYFNRTTSAQAAGSGVILTADGYILTNNHVIEGATSIQIRLTDGTTYTATLVDANSTSDLAILKISATNLTPVTFDNSDQIVVGELAVAIGNPLGTLGGTVSEGIISATKREIEIDNVTMTLLQTTAAINSGNSGGGLFNNDGNLIGIVNAKSSGTTVEGLGFAIPSNTVYDYASSIISEPLSSINI